MKMRAILLSLLAFSLMPYCYAQTYRVVILGSLRVVASEVLVDPGVWGTNLVDDTVNCILEFDVIEHPLGYNQKLGASEKPTEVGLPELPIVKSLRVGDHIAIDYKNCEVVKSHTKKPLRDEYHIFFVGQANSVTINDAVIPEFPTIVTMALALVAVTAVIVAVHRWRG